MRIIPTDFIVEINKSIIISNKGVYDNNRLLSIYSTIDYCGTLKEKICSVVRSLIKNHPFIDGNIKKIMKPSIKQLNSIDDLKF